MNKWVSVGISALVTFTITAGTGYMALGATADWPTTGQILTCVIGGLVAAARGVQHQLELPPGP